MAPVALGDPERYAVASAALAMLVGVVLIGLALLRMGFVSRFIAVGVQVGFMFGLGLTIIVGQLPKLLGVPPGEGDFFGQAGDLLGSLGDTNPWTAAIGLGSLAALLSLSGSRLPLPPALSWSLPGHRGGRARRPDQPGVEVIGLVDAPSPAPAIPRLAWSDLGADSGGDRWLHRLRREQPPWPSHCQRARLRRRARPRAPCGRGRERLLRPFQGFITAGGASQSAANDRAGAQTSWCRSSSPA